MKGVLKMSKTKHGFSWEKGYFKLRELTRSFDTLEEAKRFADGKNDTDIFISNGRYKVKWVKEVVVDERG